MKKIFKAITSAALCGCMMLPFTALAAENVTFTQEEINAANSNFANAVEYIKGNKVMGDFDQNKEVTLNDARMTLRFAAGLEKSPDSEFMYRCDMNGDGAVTPADARKILRIAARLEQSDITYLNAFNAMVNWVKPNNAIMKTMYRDEVVERSYDNKQISKDFNSQMEKLKDLDKDNELGNMNLDKELTSINPLTDNTYYRPDRYGRNCSNCNIKFPLGESSKVSSLLSLGDIKKIEYKESDTGEYACEMENKDASTGKYTVYPDSYAKISGSSITIYFNDEKAVNDTSNGSSLVHAKAFNTFNKAFDLTTTYELDDGSEDNPFAGADIGVTKWEKDASLDSVVFSGSYIKLFFNNNKNSSNYGKPIYVDYNLRYKVNIYTSMTIYLKLSKNDITDLTEVFDIYDSFIHTTKHQERTQFYLLTNT